MPRTLRRQLPWILLAGLIVVGGIGFVLSRGLPNLTAVASPSSIGTSGDGIPSTTGGPGIPASGAGTPSASLVITASPTASPSSTGTPTAAPTPTAMPVTPPPTARPTPLPPPPPPSGGTAILVGAGDIATCGQAEQATAKLLDGIPGTVFTAGDNAYNDGTAAEFANCYAPSWGRQRARTRPAPGNHDYHQPGAPGYFGYFGAVAGGPGGYYAYELGGWRVYSLNSEVISAAEVSWLRADLAAHPHACVMAYWHHPRFSSGQHGNDASAAPFWDALAAARAELIVNGHDHDYERFAPQSPAGQASATGIREIVAGTGGAGLRGFTHAVPNSEVRNGVTNGVLKLTLSPGRFGWQFIPVAGQSFSDSGQGTCH